MTKAIKNEIKVKDKANTFIFESTNYDDFCYIGGNRKIKESNLRRIINNMKKKFFISPIYVKVMDDGKLGILDGQHRFEASMELEKPIYYMIQQTMEIADVPAMNLSSNWNTSDFIKSFADQGNENYLNLIKLKKEFPDLRHNRIYLQIVQAKSAFYTKKNVVESEIRSGTFKFNNLEESKKICQMLMDYKVVKTEFKNNPWGTYAFFAALLRVFKMPIYNHKKLVKKISDSPQYIVKRYKLEEYLRDFSIIYNRNAKDKVFFENYYN